MPTNIPPLWKHQQLAIEQAKNLPGFALFFEMGTGKTRTVIELLRHHFNKNGRYLRTLIFCPPIVVENWKDEILKYSTIRGERVVPLIGTGQKRLKVFNEQAFAEGLYVPQIFVTNYETLLMKDLYARFQAWEAEIIIFDESHKLKNPRAKRSKLAEELANPRTLAPIKYLMTGTPVLNNPMDLFQQFLILDGGKAFGSNFFAFRARYFRDRNAGMPKQRYFPKWESMTREQDGFDSYSALNKRIQPVCARVKKKDCLDLPPLIRQTLSVGMTKEQSRIYNEMKNDFIAYMQAKDGTKIVNATLAITKALRMMQIASGYIKTVDGEEVEIEGNPKEKALEDLLSTLTPDHKVCVWAVWKANYARIRDVCRRLGIGFVEIHGGIPTQRKFKNVKAFNSDPAIRIMLGHPGAGGIGIEFIPSSYSIFYSRTFSLEQDLQAESRNHRGGSEIHAKITRIDLITQGTIDELIAEKLANKVEIGEKVLRDLSYEL